jgi:hypothetical protein
MAKVAHKRSSLPERKVWKPILDGRKQHVRFRPMAVALCARALPIGLAADRLRRFGVTPRALLGLFATWFIAAEFALVLRIPIPTSVPRAIIAAMGGATVLSYAFLADLFGAEVAGRGNAALNVFHVAGALALQSMIGLVVEAWPRDVGGHYPADAYAARSAR